MDKYDNYIVTALGEGGQHKPKIRQFERNYARYFPSKNTKVLDIGPGKGEMITCLSNFGFSAIEAVDISSSVVDFLKGIGYKNVYLTSNIVDFLKEQVNTYSLITMCDVVEHIPKDKILDVISAVYNSLKENGLLIVQVPNMQSITSNIFMYDDFTHEAGYTERSLTQMLTLCGFSTIQCKGFEFLDTSFRSKIVRILRSALWFIVKITRNINGTMPHKILHPVFYAIAKK
jgi:SAM-dependent methyltransferase